jgi:hypothetical protein
MQLDRSRVSLRSKFNLAAWKGRIPGPAAFANLKRRDKRKMLVNFDTIGY